MSNTIDEAFIRQYERDVHDVFQTEGSLLKPTIRRKPGVVGSSTTFQKVGKGTATTKARHGTITPMNQTHTAIQCILSDFYAGDWVDRLDEAKTNIDERRAIASGGAWALGRKVDEQIFSGLSATSNTLTTLGTTPTSAAVRNYMLEMVGDLIANASYKRNMVYGVLTPHFWESAMTITSFASRDFVSDQGKEYDRFAPVNGAFKDWMGVLWTVHPDCPGVGGATANIYAYNKMSVGYASGEHPANLAGTMSGEASIGADITWHGDRAAHFVNHAMSGGSCTIDDTGIIEGVVDDTTAVPTS